MTALVLGNGRLQININDSLSIRDFYWPHVGQENHLAKTKNKMFIFVDGDISKLTDDDWKVEISYVVDSLAGISYATNVKLGIKIRFEDTVLPDRDIFLILIQVQNLFDHKRVVKIYFKNKFQIYGDGIGDTALWYPFVDVMCHYKKDRYFAVGSTKKITDYSCAGPKDNDGQGCVVNKDGTLKDNPVTTGIAESCVALDFELEEGEKKRENYFITCGKNFTDIENEVRYVKFQGARHLYDTSKIYWKNWINSRIDSHFGHKPPKLFHSYKENENMLDLYKKSLLIMRTHFDNGGAVIASTDSGMLKEGGTDSYSYFWPRDGAMSVIAYIDTGFDDLVKSFFEYLSKVITRDGYILHKYHPNVDSGIASSWHPWISKSGEIQLPIQEDETALVLYAFLKYYKKSANQEFLNKMWSKLIFPAANFLANYRYGSGVDVLQNSDQNNDSLNEKYINSGLPLPSYDIWEQNRGINLFTVSTVYGGLMAASELAKHSGHENEYKRFADIARKIKAGVENFMYDKVDRKFVNRIYYDGKSQKCILDKKIDSSMSALWKFGMFEVDDIRIERMMESMEEKLWVNTDIGGIARKMDDHYLRENKNVKGNPWFISTLWLAQYWLLQAEPEKAKRYIEWGIKHADKTGLMSEQADPYTGYSLSVKPLTWSHAEYILTVNMLKKLIFLNKSPNYNAF